MSKTRKIAIIITAIFQLLLTWFTLEVYLKVGFMWSGAICYVVISWFFISSIFDQVKKLKASVDMENRITKVAMKMTPEDVEKTLKAFQSINELYDDYKNRQL